MPSLSSCPCAGAVANVSRSLVKVGASRNWGTFPTFRENCWVRAGSKLIWVIARRAWVTHRKQVAPAHVPVKRVSEMPTYENDLKSERLKLPASSLSILCITVFLVVLGAAIALA